jgi:hypothetical protein
MVQISLVVIGVILVLGIVVTRRSKSRRTCPEGKGLYPECLYEISVENEEFVIKQPSGETTHLPTSELTKVVIITNDSGPWGADVWWFLFGSNKELGYTFPGGATGESKMLEYVQKLPGFDNQVFIRAMGSTSNAEFVCWRPSA